GGLLAIACPGAFALNPTLDVSQYAHASWRFHDGFTKGEINSIVQTPDGYLWLGSAFGIYHFDGVKATLWHPPMGQQLPSDEILKIFVGHDATVWIGTGNGLASWGSGKLTQYPELSGIRVERIIEDHEGTLWAGGRDVPTGGRVCERKT